MKGEGQCQRPRPMGTTMGQIGKKGPGAYAITGLNYRSSGYANIFDAVFNTCGGTRVV